jgi:hypothetical protein
MTLNTVEEIERAIETLTPPQVEELYSWLEAHYPHPLDVRVETDLAAGRLDNALGRALDDEKNNRVRSI